MRKIFLTSGLVVCMASSAFAAANDINYSVDNSTTPPTETYSLETVGGNPTCQEPTLGTYTGPADFYAKWEKNSYHIIYEGGTARNLNGDTTQVHTVQGSMSQQNVTFDEAAPAISANGFTVPTGYQFAGWKGSHDLSGTQTAYNDTDHTGGTDYSPNQVINPYKVVGDLTLTALWTPLNYTVTYNKGLHAATGVDNYIDTNGAQYDKNYSALSGGDANSDTSIYAAPGYTFRGWSLTEVTDQTAPAATATFNGWAGETPWQYNTDKTVYAVYSANGYTISYNCGVVPTGASTGTPGDTISGTAPATQSVVFDGAYSLATTANGCALDGYHFIGWNCDHTLGDGNSYSYATANYAAEVVSSANVNVMALTSAVAGGTYRVVGDVSCSAMWAANTITTNWNVGTGATANQTDQGGATCTYDGSIDLPGTPSKPGYTFQGWSTTNPEATIGG